MGEAAELRALRETVGASQADVAKALSVSTKAVKYWERGDYRIPQDAWDVLDEWAYAMDEAVEACVSSALEAVGGIEGVTVTLSYYRDQAQYDRFGRDAGEFGRVNAIARETARELARRGIVANFAYPGEGTAVDTARNASE